MDQAALQQVRSVPLFSGLTDVQLECIEPGEVMDVPAGTVLGRADPAGPDGPGMYFEMRYQGRPEDPELWLSKP